MDHTSVSLGRFGFVSFLLEARTLLLTPVTLSSHELSSSGELFRVCAAR